MAAAVSFSAASHPKAQNRPCTLSAIHIRRAFRFADRTPPVRECGRRDRSGRCFNFEGAQVNHHTTVPKRRRRPVALPQASIARAIKAAQSAGPTWHIEIEGDIIRVFQGAPTQTQSAAARERQGRARENMEAVSYAASPPAASSARSLQTRHGDVVRPRWAWPADAPEGHLRHP